MKLHFAALCVVCPVFALLASPAMAQIPSGKDVVAPTTYVSFDPVARGGEFQVAVVMKIRPGFHVNAREVTEDYLIRTDLRADVSSGFKVGEAIYPKGTLQTFSFSKSKPLNVYTDSVVLRLTLTALPDAPLGAQHVPLKLRYQACSNEICLPPVTVPVEANVNVVADSSAAKPAHAEIFSRK